MNLQSRQKSQNKSVFHAMAGTIAILIVATFWISTVVSELFLGQSAVIIVKHSIVIYGLIPLVFMMALIGRSGFSLSRTRKGRLLNDKKKRMLLIALNGFLIMIPSALFLDYKAASNEFDAFFYGIQILELAMGIIQLTLMVINFRTGLRLSGRLRLPLKEKKM